METKVWYRSRTVWVSVLTCLLLFLSGSQFLDILPPAALKYIAAFGFALQIVLRALSSASQGGLTLTNSGGVDPSRFKTGTGG